MTRVMKGCAGVTSGILLVEDDRYLQDGLTELLQREGYLVKAAGNCGAARQVVQQTQFALIILDVGLPDGSGLELCRSWRADGLDTPVLFLTASDDEYQVVRGLDAGGDDYVTKPFRMQELLSRIRAQLRRHRPTTYDKDGLQIDLSKRQVSRNDQTIFLTPTEFQILSLLVRHDGQILTRGQLLQHIWDDGGDYIDDNTLSVHVSRLREKIGGQQIRTVRGVGYQWQGE